MRTLLFALCLFLVSAISTGQEKQVADKKFWVANGIFVASSIYDVESTYFALDRCQGGCVESNPITRPFIERGRPAAYVFMGAADGAVVYASYYLRKKGHNKLWIIPPLAGIAAHSIAGTYNIRLAFRF